MEGNLETGEEFFSSKMMGIMRLLQIDTQELKGLQDYYIPAVTPVISH